MAIDLEAVRTHVGTAPSDGDLQLLLEAALEAIEARFGPASPTRRERLRPFGRQWVKLGLRAEAVLSVNDDGTDLTEDDYELFDGGRYLRRLGTSSWVCWNGWVDVTYAPLSEDAQRDRVTLALIDFGLSNPQGLAAITVGPWSEQYQTKAPGDIVTERDAILSSMRSTSIGIW